MTVVETIKAAIHPAPDNWIEADNADRAGPLKPNPAGPRPPGFDLPPRLTLSARGSSAHTSCPIAPAADGLRIDGDNVFLHLADAGVAIDVHMAVLSWRPFVAQCCGSDPAFSVVVRVTE